MLTKANMCDHRHEKHVAHEVAAVYRDIAALIERSLCQQRAECRSASVGRYRYYGQLASSVHC